MYQFQVDAYTLEDYEALSRLSMKAIRRVPLLIRRMVYALFAVSYLVLGGFGFWFRRWGFGAFFVAGGIFFAVMAVFWHPLTARRLRKHSLKGVGTLTMELEEDGIRDFHQMGEGLILYSAYTDAFHYRERYFLTMEKRQVLLLPEWALVQGDAASLRAFLEAKLGKKIKEIR